MLLGESTSLAETSRSAQRVSEGSRHVFVCVCVCVWVCVGCVLSWARFDPSEDREGERTKLVGKLIASRGARGT